MKAITSILAIGVAAVAAFFSFKFSQNFEAVEKERAETISTIKTSVAQTAVADKDIKDQKAILATSTEKQAVLTQSVASLRSAESSLKTGATKASEELKVQEEEIAKLEKAVEAMNAAIAALGGEGVTIEALPDKLREMEVDKLAKEKKLEELTVLADAAGKSLVNSRSQLDRLAKRLVERSSRISKNSMEAVVTAVNQDWGFLVIGAGTNSGFAPQSSLLIERDGRKIGRVKPSAIGPNQTVAEIELESVASGVRLQPGDRVILATPSAN
jgi:predicted RNase H-like nuclease (RuvC/YqgF family)